MAAGLGGRAFGAAASSPKLRVGVLSDIHVVDGDPNNAWSVGTCDMFEKALRYFASRGVDAVVVAGDIADSGLASELKMAGDTWRKIFPGGRRPDGGKVEKVFVCGNHDVDGWRWTKNAKRAIDAGPRMQRRASWADHDCLR